ncbi:hypothetical protein DESA109040_02675 [Deinococcus saxicola]
MRAPARYYRNNVVGSLNLLQATLDTRKVPLVFSSTAAVYGTTDAVPIPENAAMQPESVYGETKLMTERMIHAFHTAHGLPYTILRYFNVCGASRPRCSSIMCAACEGKTSRFSARQSCRLPFLWWTTSPGARGRPICRAASCR